MRLRFTSILITVSAFIFMSGCAPIQRMATARIYDYDVSGTGTVKSVDNGNIGVSDALDECWIIFAGVITPDSPRAFRLAADDADHRNCGTKWVLIQSGGGQVAAAMQIGRIIRARGYNTSLTNFAGRCSSSCGLIFISGIKRQIPSVLADSKVGFHQPYRKGPNGEKICLEAGNRASKEFFAYAATMLASGPAEIFFKNAMETECNAITYFGPQELVSMGIATGIGSPRVF